MNALEKKCQCNKCNFFSKKKDTLKNHIEQIHLKLKRACEFCKKAFHPLALKRHQNVKCLSKVKEYFSCSRCSKKFSRKEHMKTHLKNIHKEDAMIIEARNEIDLENEFWCIEEVEKVEVEAAKDEKEVSGAEDKIIHADL